MKAVILGPALILALAGCTPAVPSGPITSIVTVAGLDPADNGQMRASGVVTGISESGGLCSFTFYAITGAATRLTGEGRAAGDHTDCGPVSEAVGFLVGGTYSVQLKYVPVDGDEVTSEDFPMILPTPTDLNPR